MQDSAHRIVVDERPRARKKLAAKSSNETQAYVTFYPENVFCSSNMHADPRGSRRSVTDAHKRGSRCSGLQEPSENKRLVAFRLSGKREDASHLGFHCSATPLVTVETLVVVSVSMDLCKKKVHIAMPRGCRAGFSGAQQNTYHCRAEILLSRRSS